MIVVDASALTDFLLGRPEAVTAMQREIVDREHEPLHAPDLVEPETLNALALVEALDDSVLLTGDSGLATAAGDQLGEHRVRHIP